MKALDVAVRVAGSSGLVEENTCVTHEGPKNRRKVTVPVGLDPPDRVAVSRTENPTVALAGVAAVAITGAAPLTKTVSAGSAQAVGPAGELLASPLYVATQR